MRSLRGGNTMAVIATLNPIIRGWAAYYRGVVSSRQFRTLDNYLWKLTYKWATWTPREQAEALDRQPVLRQVQQVQERPLGIRRPRQRRLPGEVLLDGHRPARHGQGLGLPRRPSPGRVLGTGGDGPGPRSTGTPAPAHQAGRAVPALRGPPPHRRPATAIPRTVGTLVAAASPAGR